MKKGKVGFDLHGVLTERPDIFREFLKFLRDMELEIHIMSGPSIEQLKKELEEYGYEEGVHYDVLFSVVDYLKQNKVEMWQDAKGDWWCDDKYWWPTKGDYCARVGIMSIFDDSRKYEPYMPYETTFHYITGVLK